MFRTSGHQLVVYYVWPVGLDGWKYMKPYIYI